MPESAKRGWDWSEVDLVWRRHLPHRLREGCTWPAGPAGCGSVFEVRQPPAGRSWPQVDYHPADVLLIYHYDAICPANPKEAHSARNLSAKLRVVPGEWVEVTHLYVADPQERHVIFMYRARGSGLFYWTGRMLVAPDHEDWQARYSVAQLRGLNVSSVMHERHVDTGGNYRYMAEPRGGAPYGAPPRECNDFLKTEVLSLTPPVRLSCPKPDGARLAWGWNASRPCLQCVPNQTPNRSVFNLHGKKVWWPYRHVQCSRSATSYLQARAVPLHSMAQLAGLEAERLHE